MKKPSDIYLAAWIAAENELPAESLKLIKDHDALFDLWRKDGFQSPIPESLKAASSRVDADPLASIAFKLRQECNSLAAKERAKEAA